jgi:hypothetical protein
MIKSFQTKDDEVIVFVINLILDLQEEFALP